MYQYSTEQEQSSEAVVHDRFDQSVYDSTRNQFQPLQEAGGNARLTDGQTFARNAFMSFYKPAPRLREDEDLTLTATLHKRILGEVMGTTEYQKVRAAGSAYDPYSSAIAAAAVVFKVVERLDRKTQQQMRKMTEAEQRALQLQQQANSLQQIAKHAQDAMQEQQALQQAAQAEQQAQQAQAQAQSLFDQIDEQGEALEDAVRRAARTALEQAEKDIEQMEEAIDTFAAPGEAQGTGQFTRMQNVESKMKLAEYLKRNKKLALIAELAGRMKNTALDKQKNKVQHPPDEVVGIETGNDLSRMISSEMYLMHNPQLKKLFYQKYVDRGLLQWELIGHEPEAKGPIIAILDSSGSMDMALTMSGNAVLTKEIWSKAVAIGGLMAVARKQKRDMAIMHFGAGGDLKTFHFPKAQGTMEELINAVDFFFDSGDTVYDDWMREAPALANQSQYAKADLVIITDGLTYIRPEVLVTYNALREARQMHAQGILLARPGEIRGGLDALASVVDKDPNGKPRLITIGDLAEDAEALDLMFSI